MTVLNRIESPQDLKALSLEELAELAQECRSTIVETITKTGGHLASNLGVVELTLALHNRGFLLAAGRCYDAEQTVAVFAANSMATRAKTIGYPRGSFRTAFFRSAPPVAPGCLPLC